VSWLTYAARRVAFAALSLFLVVTLTFLVVKTAPNTDLGALVATLQRNGASQAEIDAAVEQYRARRGLSGSTLDQFLRFVVGALTLDFGLSAELGRPVGDVLAEAVPRTLAYVLPGVGLAYAVGVAGGLVSAYAGRSVDWGVRVAAYAGLGVTSIVLGVALVTFGPVQVGGAVAGPIWDGSPFVGRRGGPDFFGTEPWRDVSAKYVWPTAVLSVGLVAGLLRHTRSAALEYRQSDAAKALAAKGASPLTSARHAVRNAALPLLSVSFAELLSVLALGAFVVESIFRIPGVAAYTMVGVFTRDYQLVVGAAFVFAVVGVAGSLLQDLLYGYLDPRIDE
jgi:peptide/nickel transport system permease protein